MIRRRLKPRRGPADVPADEWRNPAYVDWLHCQPCAVKSRRCFGAVVGAHTRNNGMRSKGPDSSRGPLCMWHHAQYDAGRVSFEIAYGIDMEDIARKNWERFQKDLP